MLYKKLTVDAAPYMASLHYIAFKNFFLTTLGKPFLSAFYKSVLLNANSVGIGGYDDDLKLICFAVGTKNNSGFYKSVILNSWLVLGIAALPALIKNPVKIKRLLTSLTSAPNNNHGPAPALLSICIAPTSMAKGFGSTLLFEFENELLKFGLNEVVLTTDYSDNEHVNSFYLKNNYILIDSFYQGKRKMNFYHKILKK
ncbi:MAG: hypothetical protein V4592_09965 [Bacteroidota bacterium]